MASEGRSEHRPFGIAEHLLLRSCSPENDTSGGDIYGGTYLNEGIIRMGESSDDAGSFSVRF